MNYSSSYAVESVSKKYHTSAILWKELVSGFIENVAISKECRSAVMSTLFVALLNTIVQQSTEPVGIPNVNLAISIYEEAVISPNDEITLY